MNRIILKTDSDRFSRIRKGELDTLIVESAVGQYIEKHLPKLVIVMCGYPKKSDSILRARKWQRRNENGTFTITLFKPECGQCAHFNPHHECTYREVCGYEYFEQSNND